MCATESLCYQIYRVRKVYVANYRGNIVDHISILEIAAYLLIQSYYVLVCLNTNCIMFVAYF